MTDYVNEYNNEKKIIIEENLKKEIKKYIDDNIIKDTENIINEKTSSNKNLDKVEDDLEDLSTAPQTMVDKGEIDDQYVQTQNEEKLVNLKNTANIYRNIVIENIKKDKDAYNIFLSFYNKFFDNIINNIYTFSKAKQLIENLYKNKINKNAIKYTIQLRDILINDFPKLKKTDFP